jgi:hypothetical protein
MVHQFTKEDLVARAEKAEEDIREGRVNTVKKQVRAEIKNW